MASAAPPTPPEVPRPLRVAVVGAGVAGLAFAYHAVKLATSGSAIAPLVLDVLDCRGVGAGASGAASGLVHPLGPSGKTVAWRGAEAVAAVAELAEAAERWAPGARRSGGAGLVRAAGAVEPGLAERWAKPRDASGPVAVASSSSSPLPWGLSTEAGTTLLLPSGLVLRPRRYLEGLWAASEALAAAGPPGAASARLVLGPGSVTEGGGRVTSVQDELWGRYDLVVLATGAATGAIAEASPGAAGGPPLMLQWGWRAERGGVARPVRWVGRAEIPPFPTTPSNPVCSQDRRPWPWRLPLATWGAWGVCGPDSRCVRRR